MLAAPALHAHGGIFQNGGRANRSLSPQIRQCVAPLQAACPAYLAGNQLAPCRHLAPLQFGFNFLGYVFLRLSKPKFLPLTPPVAKKNV